MTHTRQPQPSASATARRELKHRKRAERAGQHGGLLTRLKAALGMNAPKPGSYASHLADHIDIHGLEERGWNKGQARKHLGNPDAYAYPEAPENMRKVELYHLSRVEHAERTVTELMQVTRPFRMQRKQAYLELIRAREAGQRLILGGGLQVPVIPREQVEHRAWEHFMWEWQERTQAEPPRPTEDALALASVHWIKHTQTPWSAATSTVDVCVQPKLHARLTRITLTKIAEAYPYLAAACAAILGEEHAPEACEEEQGAAEQTRA